MTFPAPRAVLLALSVASVCLARLAHADGPAPVEVKIRPNGAAFRFAGETSGSCQEACTLHLVPGRYSFRFGDEKRSLDLAAPATLEYRGGSPGLRVAGALMFAVGLLPFIPWGLGSGSSKETSEGNQALFPLLMWQDSRATAAVAVVAASSMVMGGILYFISGPSVSVDGGELVRPQPQRSRWDVIALSGGGAALSFGADF